MKNKLLKRTEVEEIVGLGRSALYKAIKDGWFPKPIRINSGTVRWPASEIQEWIEAQIQKSKEEAND